jgi:hypothetical protein
MQRPTKPAARDAFMERLAHQALIGFSTRRPDHALSRPRALDKSNRVVFRLGGIRHSRGQPFRAHTVIGRGGLYAGLGYMW